MIDFSLKPYEWQKSMDIVMQYVNLSNIQFMDNISMVFEFLNSYDGKDYKKIVCNSVWKIASEMDCYPGDRFPLFICDILIKKLELCEVRQYSTLYRFGHTIPESDEYFLLCMESGEVSISLICNKVEILDM